jgi:transcription termination factor NusB
MIANKKYKPQLIARESAVKILYQMKIKDDSLEDIMFSFIEKRPYDKRAS